MREQIHVGGRRSGNTEAMRQEVREAVAKYLAEMGIDSVTGLDCTSKPKPFEIRLYVRTQPVEIERVRALLSRDFPGVTFTVSEFTGRDLAAMGKCA